MSINGASINGAGISELAHANTGYWNPLSWLIAFVIILILVYAIRSIGNKSRDKGAQGKPFLSGNVDEQKTSPGAGDVYWGFMEAFRPLYDPLVRAHTGRVNDYIGIFVVVLALLLIVVLLIR